MREEPEHADRPASGRLQRLGLASWWALGIIALTVVIALALSSISGVVVPLIIALVIGTVLEPIVVRLERRGLRPALATLVALLVALMAVGAITVIVGWGLLQQLPDISRQLAQGWVAFLDWARTLDIDTIWLERARSAFDEFAPKLGRGVLGFASSAFSTMIMFAIGSFFAVFFLFFVLRDGRAFPAWFAKVTDRDPDLVAEVDDLVKGSLRGYFKGVALTAVVTAPIFMVPLLLLRVPLAIPIFLLYFFLSFIPYVGAWLTAVFAVLVAFGSGGASAALIVLVSLFISNSAIQSVVSSWALGSSLRVHPAAVLIATIVGGTVSGVLGMVLAPPLMAAIIRATAAVRARHAGVLLT